MCSVANGVVCVSYERQADYFYSRWRAIEFMNTSLDYHRLINSDVTIQLQDWRSLMGTAAEQLLTFNRSPDILQKLSTYITDISEVVRERWS
jgi:hypothetical protein